MYIKASTFLFRISYKQLTPLTADRKDERSYQNQFIPDWILGKDLVAIKAKAEQLLSNRSKAGCALFVVFAALLTLGLWGFLPRFGQIHEFAVVCVWIFAIAGGSGLLTLMLMSIQDQPEVRLENCEEMTLEIIQDFIKLSRLPVNMHASKESVQKTALDILVDLAQVKYDLENKQVEDEEEKAALEVDVSLADLTLSEHFYTFRSLKLVNVEKKALFNMIKKQESAPAK